MGIYKRKQESKKKEIKISTKKRNNDNGQEKRKKHARIQVGFKEKTITIQKKEGRNWKTQIRMKH